MEVIKRPLGLYKANCYVLIKEGKSIIIDPGFHCNHIIDMVADSEPIAVLLTHGHCDHVSALDEVCEYYTHCNDLVEGQLNLDPFDILVHHTPGHSAGSVCLEIEGYLFTGDTLFKQNVGNTDNYKSDPADLIKSLKYLLTLSKDLIVEPGHRESTILKNEEEFIKNIVV